MPLHAGSDFKGSDFKKSIVEPQPEEPGPPLNIVKAEESYVFESGFRRGAGKLGDQDALETFFLAAHRFPLGGRWYFKVGGAYHRFDFGTSRAPLETTLQSAAAVLALEYIVGDDVGFFIESRPGFYFSDDVSGDSFDAPTAMALAYPVVDEKFYLIGGVAYTGFSGYPVVPLAGLLWHINPQWSLKAYLPEPRLVYHASDALDVWVGGELTGGSYRTENPNANPKRIRGAVVDYAEWRAGAGFCYRVCPGFKFDAAAGYVFSRQFDYHRAGETYGLEGAPYVKIGGIAEF